MPFTLTSSVAPMYFLGAATPRGFRSLFADAYNPEDGWRAFIMKGGPGSGKSTMMKKIYAALDDTGEPAELIPCASDPASLDGVIFEGLKTCILDGTAPHVLEPIYPGACETILNTGDCWNAEELYRHRAKIIEANAEIARLHDRAGRYITAAGALIADSHHIALEHTDTAKAARFAAALMGRKLPKVKKGSTGTETRRFLSAVTPMGHLFFEDTIHMMADDIVVIEDEYGAVSRTILAMARAEALEHGLSVITCLCPLSVDEKIEHLFIPSLSLAFCTSNRYHPVTAEGRAIHVRRFIDAGAIRLKKQRLSFNRKAARELIASAALTLAEAREAHNTLEKIYMHATDFAKVSLLAERTIDALTAHI